MSKNVWWLDWLDVLEAAIAHGKALAGVSCE